MMRLRKRDKATKLLRQRSAPLQVERLEARLMLAAEASPLVINLNIGNDLAANEAARAAFERAAEFWEGVLFDPVVLNINAEFTDEGFFNDNVLGLSESTMVRFLYGDVRSRLIADASADEALLNQLPTPDQLNFDLADGISINAKPIAPDVVIELTRANALALGFTELPDSIDASITFNSRFDFDFDNSDGVDSGSFDFEALAIHEIAHAMGFVSAVDDVDFFVNEGDPFARVDPMVMDLFRLAPAQGDSFSTATRILNTGDAVPVQVFHDGQFDVSVFDGSDLRGLQTGDIPLATGVELGDGRQASHLKDSDQTDVLLGLMEPTFSRGIVGGISQTDLRILGLIGWDWHDSGPFGEPPSVTVDMQVTIETQPELSGTVSEADAQVFVRLPEAFGDNRATLFVDGDPSVIDAFRLTNNSTSSAKISRVEIILPRSGIKQNVLNIDTPFFDTSGSSSQDFKAVPAMAAAVGLLSPESDDENDADVADSTKTLTLTFDDFDPGESLAWRIDLDREERFDPPIDGHDLVGGSVHVFFDDGSVARKTLLAVSGNNDASAAILSVGHVVLADNHGDGTWILPAGNIDPLAPGTYNVEVTVIDSSGARATDDSSSELIVFPPNVGRLPRVEAIFVGSSQWTDEMRAAVGEAGIVIPTGSEHSVALPWTTIDQISVRFSRDVVVSADDLTLLGVNLARYEPADFQYDADAHVATWTLAAPLRADKLHFELSDAIHDESFKPLDGNWTNGVSNFPSGNGLIESDDRFVLRFNVLPGDVSGDGEVTRRDLLDVIYGLSTTSDSGRYDPRLDVTGDGLIDLDDLRAVIHHLGAALPSGEPGDSGNSTPLIATDAFFDRLGGSPAPSPRNAVIETPVRGQPAFATVVEESGPAVSSVRPQRVRTLHRRVARSATIKPRPLVAPGRFHGDFHRDRSLAVRRDQRSRLYDI
ncbi:MAG: NF038122 family metalloprotease [Planctomycetes bacterium]|nr:NF038122 family metalloprotease [Planctomycetota bacterium]